MAWCREARPKGSLPDHGTCPRGAGDLVQVVPQLAAAGGMAELAQRFGLDLPDALARDVELLAHLFERAVATVDEPEAQLEHVALALGEAVEHAVHLLAQQ